MVTYPVVIGINVNKVVQSILFNRDSFEIAILLIDGYR